MNEERSAFDFLTAYCATYARDDTLSLLDCKCKFNSGISRVEAKSIQVDLGIEVPDELLDFYEFSYGATFCYYRILKLPEIADFRSEIRDTYRFFRVSILPFAYLVDVGDYVVFDLAQSRNAETLILDGFHELGPDEWAPICFGLRTFLWRLAENKFEQFWLKPR